MTDRSEAFLANAGWGDARRKALAGDASARGYQRLFRFADHDTAILMIAPPGAATETARFLTLARHLAAAGLSAPRVLAEDPEAGLVLLEDLGDALLARLSESDPAREPALYLAAVEALAALQRAPMPAGLAAPDASEMAAMIAPLVEWYLPHSADLDAAGARLADNLRPLLSLVLEAGPRVLVHRDYHAENLIWLPERIGPARIGMLDFQDAFAGPPAYDLVSLVEDARRGLGAGMRAHCIARFAVLSGRSVPDVTFHCSVIGAQRNLRILGIFARLARQAGKPRYLGLLPRVWTHLTGDLAHPALRGLRAEVARVVPPPGPEHLERLRTQWQIAPSQ